MTSAKSTKPGALRKKRMRIACVVGARPNFMKMAPILKAFEEHEHIEICLIHTGQHYDPALSGVFFTELGIRKPDISLGVGSGSQGEQTAKLLIELEIAFVQARVKGEPFDRVLVVGDVNSTLAAALAAAKLQIPVAHVEAGLRSFDRSMPEEINRVVTDSLADLLFVSEPAGVENLLQEGQARTQIKLVGNVMIDTLLQQVGDAKDELILKNLAIRPREFCVVTLHRPANVDSKETLMQLIETLARVSEELPVVFPVHPRTRQRLEQFGLADQLADNSNMRVLGPLGYKEFLCLTSQAKVVVSDSGGLQEECTALGVPCLTMRENTERPITVSEGSSTLCGGSAAKLKQNLRKVLDGAYHVGKCPDLWDGNAGRRIVSVIANDL